MRRWFAPAAALLGLLAGRAAADPDALWYIISEQCVPDQQQAHSPKPCALVDLAAGYVVLKDRDGNTQFLVMPTARITGIESPAILAPDAPNYWQDAWDARRFVDARDLPGRRAVIPVFGFDVQRSPDSL